MVCYLDESWPDKVDSSQLPEKLKGDKLQPGSFNVLKEGTFESGAQVAYKKEGEWKNGIVLQVSGDKLLVTVKCGDEKIETGLKKIGAMLGDRVEVGCNSVLNPGTVIGRDSNVYPTSCVRGTIPEKSIWKNNGTVVPKK